MRVLLVEDEAEMAAALTDLLTQNQFVVDHVRMLDLAQEALLSKVHDAMLLDRQLPDGEGLDFLKKLRREGESIPVVVLTAHNMPPDRVSGLNLGADDYVGKPFLADELIARLRAVIRRSETNGTNPTISEGNVVFDPSHNVVSVDGAILNLPRREVLVLQLLLRRAGRTVLRRTLEDTVYGYDDEIQSNALDSHVSKLRRKLAEAGATVTIHSMRGLGYLLRAT
jgi:DNA-binding response OmpR family regulator